MTDNTKMREALIKFGDENPALDLDFRLHTHGKYLTQEKAIVASRAFKAGAAWQAAQAEPEEKPDFEKLESLGWQIAICAMCGTHASAIKPVQSVPVVGEPVAYLKADAAGKVLWSEDCVCEDAVWAGEDSEFGEYSLPVYRKPTNSITATELATLREKAAEADELRKDAERYRWLRMKGAHSDAVDKVHMFGPQLDTAIDAAIAQSKGE